MFLHIGNNEIINKNDIIGIFNIKKIKEKKEFENIIIALKEKENLIIINNNEKNTLIITSEKNNIKGYITNISSITLAKRIEKL